jgi:hypothetical protein
MRAPLSRQPFGARESEAPVSYDLYFLKAEVCADTAVIHDHLEASESATTPESDARKRELAAVLQRENPLLEIFPFDYEKIADLTGTTIEQARQTHNHIELNGPEGGTGSKSRCFQIRRRSRYRTGTKGREPNLCSRKFSDTPPFW